MSEPNKYREWILETIDSLRSRKARPDLERICRMVRRRHGSDPDRTRTELDKLIQEQTVLKVSYKGSISYRNAAKVQRKSRKRSEFGGGADAPRERTKPDHPNNNNNNGDSAHSFTDPEEGETEPDPRAETSVSSRSKKLQSASSPGSGNGRLGCGATTSCAAGSGCEEEKASAPRDKGLGQQGEGGCLPLGGSTGDRNEDVPSGGGKKPGVCGAETRSQTYSGSDGQAQTQRQTESGQPKLRLGGGTAKAAHRLANSELRDLAALSEKPLRAAGGGGGGGRGGGSAAATRGHVKPLGLKEILGYLSSQERLSEEKLTRGKVKVVMEREVERGRLRRTRCGNITLPLRGSEPDEPAPTASSADRVARSATQDRRAAKKSSTESDASFGAVRAARADERAAPRASSARSRCQAARRPVLLLPSPLLLEVHAERSAHRKAARQAAPGVGRGIDFIVYSPLHPQAHPESEPMETGEEEEEDNDGDDGDPRSSDEDGGLSPVAMKTGAGLAQETGEDACCPREQPEERPQRQREDGKGVSELDFPPLCRSPPADGAPWSECDGVCSEEGAFSSDHLGYTHQDEVNLSTSSFHNLEYKTEIGASSCLLTPTASPRDSSLPEERGATGSSGGHMKFGSTGVSPVDWTVSDVVSYITAVGFPEQAAAFRTQEIDGKSLLLMQRNDVLTGLSIKLGPALKIYERHIKVLQKTHFEDNDCYVDAKNTLGLLC
ncbi:sterile alpha motif domain-containing protein 1-like [Poeciliopsis prolifica]|uniref:sterile alpha motif domain-containing protein 1-like n=1 Tax=Poeciliopsis prolifica TaxID=188132 RepID=UPI002413CBDA|nr:sterile alpha motif domain-containing protein 1-like [Poeciliopsis prolifica]